MPLPWMSAVVSVTTGQPLTPWIPVQNARLVKFLLYCLLGEPGSGHLIMEGAEEVDGGGNAVYSEIISAAEDISASPGQQASYRLEKCHYAFVRLSAHADSPGYLATRVSGGVEVYQ